MREGKMLIIFLIIASLFFNVNSSFADRVCIEKGTGKLIEYQSGDAPLGTLAQNAVNVGYTIDTIIEKYITPEEWKSIKKQWIDDPAEKEKQNREKIRKQKEDKIKTKLNLSENEWNDLKDALK